MRPTGPIPAAIMIVGDYPSAEDLRWQEPFVGAPGRLLSDFLHRAGIPQTSCYRTYLCRHLPPAKFGKVEVEEWYSENKKSPDPSWTQIEGLWVHPHIADGVKALQAEIDRVKPSIILTLGHLALWGLTGFFGAGKWRGSRLTAKGHNIPLVPSYAPREVLHQPRLGPAFQVDLRRVKNILTGQQKPRKYRFILAPRLPRALRALRGLLQRLDQGPLDLALDLETRGGAIACLGLGWSETQALVLPFLRASQTDPFFYPLLDEVQIRLHLSRILAHPNLRVVGQNLLYDYQYLHREGFPLPQRLFDTMIGWHSMFSTLRKGLDFITSMLAHDYVYWKDESKNWDPEMGEAQLWFYNGKDCAYTYEDVAGIFEQLKGQGTSLEPHFNFQQSLFFPVLRMMLRGVRYDDALRATLDRQLVQAGMERQARLEMMVGHSLNPKSPLQIKKLFYEDLKQPNVTSIKTGKLTVDSAALESISTREPLLTPLVQTIAELRSIGVFRSTFVQAPVDPADGRMRCSFAVAGPTTFRFASSTNAFDSGMNLQNLPVEEKVKISRAVDYVKLPNIRRLFIPDPGYEFFDIDLDRADLQIVVWEAADADLKMALREGLDMHLFNAMQVWNLSIPVDELKESHPNYPIHKKKHGKYRQLAKAAVHATNYGVGDRKLAITLGITVMEASNFRARWFAAHPGIKKWHERTEAALRRGWVTNPFGARFYPFGDLDLPEALAWQPQSAVAGVINRALVNIDRAHQAGETAVELLLQVHDSLAGQYPISTREESRADLLSLARVVVPYDDPLIIPVGIKTSTTSWGDCA